MINNVIAKVFGTANERAVKKLLPTLPVINAFEESLKPLSDDELRAKTHAFKEKIAAARDAAAPADSRTDADKEARGRR